MKMYVANATRQTVNFMYRLPGQNGLKSHFIPVGKQMLLPFDLNSEEVDYIVRYNQRYGFVDTKDIDRTKPYTGLIYSLDKPVPTTRLGYMMDHNLEVLTDRGKRNRELAAVAANQTLENELDKTPGMADLNGLEMTIVEETRPGQATSPNPINEGFRVDRSAEAPRAEGRREGGRGGKGKRNR
jgi:hypothetical protein